ncbi:hypothetical protein [Microbacterium candidum]|uniref:Fido domain-containing protein n=1 Tax=Microbacterium candidum TaxID=3041922 RepID=A0ABT7N3C2_9MICO|nr:hypothetical protein [Microbacterium sp. ASV49]MDL9981204.1 hypothetical protein [Microbacterium sp. ASV49]
MTGNDRSPRWGAGPEQYGAPTARPPRTLPVSGTARVRPEFAQAALQQEQLRLTGVYWDIAHVDLSVIGHAKDLSTSDASERARQRFRARKPDFIWDAARLEGNTFTLPEVRTLLEGVTVQGKPLDDQNQILALNEGFNELDRLVGNGQFDLTKPVSDRLHALVAAHEAIDSGMFRGEGQATGGGTVRLSSGGVVDGRPHGDGGVLLREAYADLLDYLTDEPDPRVRALVYAASVIRHQLYFDGNKRTAKLMASGELMRHGFDAISIPYARLYEQNLALDELFTTDDATGLMRLMADCAR